MSLQLPRVSKRRAESSLGEEPKEKRRLTIGDSDDGPSSAMSPISASSSLAIANSNNNKDNSSSSSSISSNSSNALFTAHAIALPSPPTARTIPLVGAAPMTTCTTTTNTGAAGTATRGGSGCGSSTISPYGPAYHHNAAGAQPGRQRLSSRRCGLRIGDVPLEDANLFLPQDKSAHEIQRIRLLWQTELERQEANPPALPPSAVPPLPPKETLEEYHEVPETATEAEKDHVRTINCAIAAQSQKIDRERNNQAAKKSRVTRLEKLHNTRVILNDKAAECDWQRLKVIQLGGDPTEWERLSDRIRQRLVAKIEERVTACDQLIAEDKKREEQRKRTERTRARMQAREGAAAAAAAAVGASEGLDPGAAAGVVAGTPTPTLTPGSTGLGLNMATPLMGSIQLDDMAAGAHGYGDGLYHPQQP